MRSTRAWPRLRRVGQLLLTANQHTIPVPSWGAKAVRFCLSAHAAGTAQGSAFALGEVRAVLARSGAPADALAQLVRQLLRAGALEVVREGKFPPRAGAPAVNTREERELWREVLLGKGEMQGDEKQDDERGDSDERREGGEDHDEM